MGEPPLAQGLASLQARENKTGGQEDEVSACAARRAQMLLAVDGEIVAQNAPANAKETHVGCKEPAFQQEKPVPRDGGDIPHDLPLGQLDGGGIQKAYARHDESQPKEDFKVVHIMIDEYAYGGCKCRCEVVAYPVIAYTLAPPGGRKHINRHRTVGHSGCTERRTVQGAEDGEHDQAPCQRISAKQKEVGEQAQQQHLLAGEAVNEEAAERTHQQCQQRIAGKNQPYHILGGMEGLTQI